MERRELVSRIADHIVGPFKGKPSVERTADDILRARDTVLAEAGERVIDRVRLEQWLFDRSRGNVPLVGAVYEGLLARVRRGEFDEEGR